MNPVNPEPAATRNLNSPKVSLGIVLIIAAIIVSVGVLSFGTDLMLSYIQSKQPVNTTDQATNALLGAWKETSSLYFDSSSTSSPQTVDYATSTDATYLGFAIKDGFRVMRTYDSPGTPAALSQLELWEIGTSTGGVFNFDTFDYSTSTYDQDTHEINHIRFPTHDTMILRSHEYGGSYQERSFKRVRSASEESAMNFNRSASETQSLCDDLLNRTATTSDDYIAHSVLLPLSCTTSIGPGVDDVTFTFNADGSLDVIKSGKLIFELLNVNTASDDATNTADLLDQYGFSGPFLNQLNAFTLQDVTFDGYKDIAVLYSAGAYNYSYDYYAFDPATGMYDSNPIVTATNPNFDAGTRTITDYGLGRGLGDIYTYNVFHFQNGEYVLVERDNQDFKDQTNYDESKGYIYTEQKLIGGKMQTVKTVFRSEKDVWGDGSDSSIDYPK